MSDIGAAYRNRGEFKRAIASFEKAKAADPAHWQALLNIVLLQAFDAKNPEAAQKAFEELKQKLSRHSEPRQDSGTNLTAAGGLETPMARASLSPLPPFAILFALRALRLLFAARGGPRPRVRRRPGD